MAQQGTYNPESVIVASARVLVNGIERPWVSMDWSGDTTGGLPDQVVSAGSGMRSRTGAIRWAQSDAVTADPPHPLRRTSGWPPREGDSVVIDATVDTGTGPVEFRRFTGRLGRTTGSLVDGTLESEITDMLGDALRAVVSIPPTVTDARHYSRSYWAAWAAIEAAGLGTVPPATRPRFPDGETVIHQGMQGGLRPLVGVFVRSGTESGDASGLSAWSNVVAGADPSVAAGSRDVLVIARGARTTWDPSVTVTFTDDTTVTLALDRKARVLTVTRPAGAVTYPWRSLWALPMLAFQVRRSAGVRVWLSDDPADFVEVTGALPTTEVSQVTGSYLTGVEVRYLARAGAGVAVVASVAEWPAHLYRSTLEQERITGTRSFENATARSVVDAWSEATLSSLWMDERGVPMLWARDRLIAQTPARSLVVDERVFAGSWSAGDDQVRSEVIVTGEECAPHVSPAGAWSVTLWEPTSPQVFDTPTTLEEFVEVPASEEWGPLRTYLRRAGSDSPDGNSLGRGSWMGAVITEDGDQDRELWAQHNGAPVLMSWERLGHRSTRITTTVSGVSQSRQVHLKTPVEGTTLHPTWRDRPLPILRGEWKTVWGEYSVSGASRGPAYAPPLEHSAGWWLTPADAQRVADALSAEVTSPMVTMSGVSLLWDPRRQIGDVEEWTAIDSQGRPSWTARVLIAGYSESWDGDVPSQSVDVRVVSLVDALDGKTYRDLSAAYSDYQDMSSDYAAMYAALPEVA